MTHTSIAEPLDRFDVEIATEALRLVRRNGGLPSVAVHKGLTCEEVAKGPRYIRGIATNVLAAAEERITDVRKIAGALQQAVVRTSDTGHAPSRHSETSVTWDLPLASPPRVGILGWWQIDDLMAAVVSPTDRDNAFSVETVVGTTRTPDGQLVARLLPGRAILWADGESWSVEARPGRAAYSREELNEWAALATFNAAVILLACSIAQADPTVVTNVRTPKSSRTKARRKKRVTAKTTTTISLPGLRYADGKFHAAHPTTGKAWHLVRGHWRRLESPRFTNKQGERVWVKPHPRGSLDNGRSSRGYTID